MGRGLVGFSKIPDQEVSMKTTWADPAGAARPGFLVHLMPSVYRLLHGPFEPMLGSLAPSSPATCAKKGSHSASFCDTKGAHTELGQACPKKNMKKWVAETSEIRPKKSILCKNKFEERTGTRVTIVHAIIHIIFNQNISRYWVGELYPINLPQNFSRHAPVTKNLYTDPVCLYSPLANSACKGTPANPQSYSCALTSFSRIL